MIILGSRELLVFSQVDGSLLSDHSLPCVPTQPLVLGDINNDVSDEFLVRCSDRSVHKNNCTIFFDTRHVPRGYVDISAINNIIIPVKKFEN